MLNQESIAITQEFLSFLPPRLKSIYGYGSGFYKQPGNTPTQYDLLLFYDDRKTDLINWLKDLDYRHPEYLPQNTKKLIYGMNQKIVNQKLTWGNNIVFFPYLPFEGNLFKIGIISYDQAILDLNNWNHDMCIPHRLGKATFPFKTNPEMVQSIQLNKRYFLIMAILSLGKNTFSKEELFYRYCQLSYMYDIRTIFHFENKNKITNLVVSAKETLEKIMEQNQDLFEQSEQLVSITNWHFEELNLPDNLRTFLNQRHGFEVSQLELQKLLLQYLKHKNLLSSILLPLKEINLNGLAISENYTLDKLKKVRKKPQIDILK